MEATIGLVKRCQVLKSAIGTNSALSAERCCIARLYNPAFLGTDVFVCIKLDGRVSEDT